MKSKITKFAAAAVIILAVFIGITQFGNPFDARRAFARVIESVQQARTFSCHKTEEYPHWVNEQMMIREISIMFKEPNLERRHSRYYLEGMLQSESIDIVDYDKHQVLEIKPMEKTAAIYNTLETSVDPETGLVTYERLSTRIRQEVLNLSDLDEVVDLGFVEMDGRSVRMLQSLNDYRIITIWYDPVAQIPVQIEVEAINLDGPNQRTIYASILIDQPLDSDLFNMEPPEGYDLMPLTEKIQRSVNRVKLMSKISYLQRLIVMYQKQNNGSSPGELSDLVTTDLISEQAFTTLMAPPDDPFGPPAIRYRAPTPDSDWGSIILYEAFDKWAAWPSDGIVVGFRNSSVKSGVDQAEFEWSLDLKLGLKWKWFNKMGQIYGVLDKFRRKNNGSYPTILTDLVTTGITTREKLDKLLADPYDPDGPPVIRYHQPHSELVRIEWATTVVFYEGYDQWPNEGIAVAFRDGHVDIITDQNNFEELIK